MLKRTCCPFYGKSESRIQRAATAAFQRGDVAGANRIHTALNNSRLRRIDRHVENGRRKPCASRGR